MDLSFTESQIMFRNAARQLVEREYPRDVLVRLDGSSDTHIARVWDRVADTGLLGILIPEKYGGLSSSLTDAAMIFQELGRGPVPGPYFSTAILAALVIMTGANETQRREILPRISTGKEIIGVAITESEYGWDPKFIKTTAIQVNDRYIINGTKLFIHDAQASTSIICIARLEDRRLGLFLVDAKSCGVNIMPMNGFTTSTFSVDLQDVAVPKTALLNSTRDGWQILKHAIMKAIPVLSCYQVGACESIFDMTLSYSNTRFQFGVPIGRFQRVQDHIIDILNLLDAARWITYEALWKLDTNRPAESSIHMAKVVASDAYYQACNASHEVHAGVGVMREYGLTIHTKMSRTLYHYLGDPTYHKNLLTKALRL